MYNKLCKIYFQFPAHPDNNIVGVGDSLFSQNNNGLDSAKHQYRPPSSWSTGTGVNLGNSNQPKFNHKDQDNQHFTNNNEDNYNNDRETTKADTVEHDNLTGAASQDARPTFQPTPQDTNENNAPTKVTLPSKDLLPPATESSEEFDLDIRMKDREDPVYNFIKRFDPNSPDSHKTAMTTSEIIDINSQLPTNQDVSREDERTARKHKHVESNFNKLHVQDKSVTETNRFNSVNQKPTISSLDDNTFANSNENSGANVPERVLLPPKRDQSALPSTTMGPPIYYEWKWAVPAFDLEPPKLNNITQVTSQVTDENSSKSPFRDVTRPTPKTVKVTQPNTEYNTSSYFVPDYIFPLDKEHPGYDDDNAETSFKVKVSRAGRASFGENPACPQCHPAYLTPGTCEPCIVKR